MKKYVPAALAVCTVLIFVSCNDIVQESIPWTGTTVKWSSAGISPAVYEVPQNAETVEISAVGPVDIFYARMNPGTSVIDGSKTRYLTDIGSVSRNALIPGFPAFFQYADRSAAEQSDILRRDFEPARDFFPESFTAASTRSAGDLPSLSVPQITPDVNVSSKELWVDVSAGTAGSIQYGSSFLLKKNATLRAVGTYCYVWIVDDYYGTGPQKVSSQTANELKDKFDGMYELVRHIFGGESEYMVKNTSEAVAISDISDTGSIVNIVISDIEGDYRAGQTSGTFGYFWSKDYFSNSFSASAPYVQSNEGKYFYVDAYFTNAYPDIMYSTIAHEFQHMINFGVKWLTPKATGAGSGAESATWYNEMLSMLCEDMMQSHLGISDDQSPKSRLSQFCAAYPLSGVTDWLPGNNVLQSYAGAYAFGAYLARNYGGPDFVSKIAQNASVNQTSISAALLLQVPSENFNSVFAEYAAALVFTDPSSVYSSFNNRVEAAAAYNGYTYPMTAIDIFGYEWKDSGRSMYGPALFYADMRGRITLRPYGFTLHAVGYTETAGTVSLTFSEPLASSEKLYLLVQPHTGS